MTDPHQTLLDTLYSSVTVKNGDIDSFYGELMDLLEKTHLKKYAYLIRIHPLITKQNDPIKIYYHE